LGYGDLEINLSLDDIQLCLGELSLGIENKKDRLGAQFVFSFVGMKVSLARVTATLAASMGVWPLRVRAPHS